VSDDAKFMTLDIKEFYLMTPLPHPESYEVPFPEYSAQAQPASVHP
jgi:hypothetical protein